MKSFDWDRLLRESATRLGLRPAEFWALTPIELIRMLGLSLGAAPMTRSRLFELDAAMAEQHRERSENE